MDLGRGARGEPGRSALQGVSAGGVARVPGRPASLSPFLPSPHPASALRSARLRFRDDREHGACAKGTLEDEAGQLPPQLRRRQSLGGWSSPQEASLALLASSHPGPGLRGGQGFLAGTWRC
ncbi:unnamed protein product [Gulo gulo]|uniref:Uncharacterized protein n=1 Tax=Gulo gulo TaxID=48420 RepID=A0A9X9MCG4_GULGU|nr:unnamed protein product [Gulo gulo]